MSDRHQHTDREMTMSKMIYGRATVELLMSRDQAVAMEKHNLASITEEAGTLNVWARVDVFSFTPHRGGINYDICQYAGGWAHASNVRNFERLDLIGPQLTH